MTEYADKLADGLPCLPKDVENLRKANAALADEVIGLKQEIESLSDESPWVDIDPLLKSNATSAARVMQLEREIKCLANGEELDKSASDNAWIAYGRLKSLESDNDSLKKEVRGLKGDLAYFRGLYELCREDYKKIADRLFEWRNLTDSGMRLHCGEMTAQEIRTVRAVLNAITK